MRLVVIGQAAFGAKTLEALLNKGETVVAAYAPPDRGGKADPLKEAALAGGIPVFQPKRYKDDQVFEQYKALQPDLTVLAFVTDIIPQTYLDLPTHGSICYHPSLLPRHRGASAINWAVIMGDTRTGLSIFWPDSGIDTGPILLQKEIRIGAEDTTGSLYFNHLFPMGVDAILESVALIKAKSAPKVFQDHSLATYEPPCNDQVAAIDWRKPALEVYNLIRGCDPQPGAYTVLDGEKIRFYGAKLMVEPNSAAPGTLLEAAPQGLHVAVPGGKLLLNKVRCASGKIAAQDWASQRGLKAGDRL